MIKISVRSTSSNEINISKQIFILPSPERKDLAVVLDWLEKHFETELDYDEQCTVLYTYLTRYLETVKYSYIHFYITAAVMGTWLIVAFAFVFVFVFAFVFVQDLTAVSGRIDIRCLIDGRIRV